ncbi:3-hydroxybutyrate dehydrogenase [Pseudovibrio exalbescens]|uniref:3-hydroxybutyrate dehydrogenase n=1 Tax=Pseudovibrio exalbescens TaxID=197461 RepID=UPI0023662520|nr:3-hydroxybutyrate dehydrogenase [Pseudovibrio exalbescens]MDD7910265.1 3-hydroxybutyrate dehydrogenase [Pseudovibrio exalbescens]
MTLSGKTVLVTGSSSGIGLGIAEGLAKAGLNVMMNGIEPAEAVEAERARLEALGSKVRYTSANLMDPSEVRGLVKATEDAFGRVDVLVNNAGIQHVAPIEEFPEDKWDAIIALNLSSSFHAMKAVVPGMKAQGWGRVVNIASAHGLVASPFKSAYVAAKHGVIGLTKTVALETAEAGITVNAICPGYVLTPLVEKQIQDTAKARGISEEEVKRDVLLAAQPTKQFVSVEQLAGTTLFLCSDDAASITGSAIPVEGGWVAH